MSIENVKNVTTFTVEANSVNIKPVIHDLVFYSTFFQCKPATRSEIVNDAELNKLVNVLQNYIHKTYEKRCD